MKQPTLKFKEVFVVSKWSNEVVKGQGIFFSSIKRQWDDHSNVWLVWLESNQGPEMLLTANVFMDLEEAEKTLSSILQERMINAQEHLANCIEKVEEARIHYENLQKIR